MFKKFKWFINYYKKNYILGLILLLLSDIVGILIPLITGKLIDAVYYKSIGLDKFVKYIRLTLLLILFKYLFAMGRSYFVNKGANEIEYITRGKLMKKFLGQSQEFFEKNSTGSLMGKSTNDVLSIADFAGFGVLAFFDSTVFPLCIIIIMIVSVDVKLSLLSILPLPFLALIYMKIGDKIYSKYSRVNMTFDKLNSSVLEDVEGVRIIRVYNIFEQRRKIFEKRGRDLADKNIDLIKLQAMIAPIERVVTATTFVIAISYGARLISNGAISIGQLMSFTYYLNMLVRPMYAMGEFINTYQQANASMDRIEEVLNYKEDIKDSSNLREVAEGPDLAFDNHSFRYPTGKEDVLSNIDLAIDNKSSLGILGKTASGKTTLVKQLLDLYKVDKSSILVDGEALSKVSEKSLKGKISYVPQKQMLFSDTIRNNIKFSKPDATEEEILRAVELADFKKDLVDFEDGLDTLVGEKGISLSGGQKQRLSIARALLKDFDILILDDAMSALDATTEQNIIRNLRENFKDKTLIIIAHRISQVQDLDHIIVLDQGRIVEEGNHDSLMKEESWYRDQYLRQTRKEEV